jgi:large subunit ribosomal protein L19
MASAAGAAAAEAQAPRYGTSSPRPRFQLTSASAPPTIVPPPPSTAKICPEPALAVQAREIARVDPAGARTWLFSRANPEGMRVRDIVLVRQRTGEPFAGVVLRKCYNRLNSSFMLRNTLLGVGVEREFKLYSPGVAGIEIVQRALKRPKQKRIYYMR